MLHGWRFCPRCAGELDVESGRVVCAACGFVMYANSQPTACALITDREFGEWSLEAWPRLSDAVLAEAS